MENRVLQQSIQQKVQDICEPKNKNKSIHLEEGKE
jgi:hypothetical protein